MLKPIPYSHFALQHANPVGVGRGEGEERDSQIRTLVPFLSYADIAIERRQGFLAFPVSNVLFFLRPIAQDQIARTICRDRLGGGRGGAACYTNF